MKNTFFKNNLMPAINESSNNDTVVVNTTKSFTQNEADLYKMLQDNGLVNPDSLITTSYSKSIKTGVLNVSYLTVNRDISKVHVENLRKSAMNSSNKKFVNAAIACLASDILTANEHEPDASKWIHLVDSEGNEITKETPNLGSYIAIIEGQHRTVACETAEQKDLDIDVNIVRCPSTPEEIRQYIINLNSSQKKWSMMNWMNSNAQSGKSDGTLKRYVNNLCKTLGVSPKYAMYLLKFQQDAYKTSTFEKGSEGSLTDVEKERGDVLGKALAVLTTSKNGAYAKRIEFIDWIIKYDNAHRPTSYLKNISGYLANLSETDSIVFAKHIKDKNIGKGYQYFIQTFEAFCSKHEKDIDEVNKTAQIAIDNAWNRGEEKAKTRRLKSGSAYEIMNQYEEAAIKKRKNEEKKALKKKESAEKAA